MRMLLVSCFILLFSLPSAVLANVEKTIFLGPPAITIPTPHANLDDLYLIPISLLHPTARTRLNASFPTNTASKGTATWVLLDGLTPGARYEVRICWLATQPTAFSIYTYTLTETFEKSELLKSLSTYAHARQTELDDFQVQQLAARRVSGQTIGEASRTSILFLQIFAAAKYFSLNKTLMSDVPPVLVDIILDPYLLNVFPKSLVPTAGYLIALAILGWVLSGVIWRILLQVADASPSATSKNSNVLDKKLI